MGQVALLVVTGSVVLRCSSLTIGRIPEDLCMPVARFPRRTTLGYSVDSAAGRRALDPPARYQPVEGQKDDRPQRGHQDRPDVEPRRPGAAEQPHDDPADDG